MLIKAKLQTQIKALLIDLSQQTDNQQQAIDSFAERLATVIDVYIKTATVNVTVATTGTAAAQTGTGTGTLS